MIRYQPRRFHPFVGIAAAAMTALTFVLSVGVPSSLAPTGGEAALAANAKARAIPAMEVAIILPRIDVVGVRDTTVAERHQKQRV